MKRLMMATAVAAIVDASTPASARQDAATPPATEQTVGERIVFRSMDEPRT